MLQGEVGEWGLWHVDTCHISIHEEDRAMRGLAGWFTGERLTGVGAGAEAKAKDGAEDIYIYIYI